MKYIFYFIVSLAMCSNLLAGDGSELLHICQTYLDEDQMKESISSGFCIGFLHGVSSTTAIFPELFRVCIPDGVSSDQLVRVVIKYLEDHPAELHEQELVLTVLAFREAFPCPEAE